MSKEAEEICIKKAQECECECTEILLSVGEEEDENPQSKVPSHAHKALRCHVENLLLACKDRGVTVPPETVHGLIKQTSSVPPLRVGFYGDPKTGKSTIIDRLLGINLLRSSSLTAASKMVVELLPHADNEREDFLFQFTFVAEDAVREWHQKAISDAQFWRDNVCEDPPSFLKWFVFHFTEEEVRLAPCEFLFETQNTDDLPKYKAFRKIYGRSTSHQRVARSLDEPVFEEHKQFATFVQHVSIFGPFHALRALHITVVDIPSVHEKETWLWEERSRLAARMCKDIYFVTDHCHLGKSAERRLLELSRHCDKLFLCCTHASSFLKPHTHAEIDSLLSHERLSQMISTGIRTAEDWNWRLMDVLQQIGDGVYALENREGEQTEFDPLYDAYWARFVESLQARYGERFDRDANLRTAELNRLLTLARRPCTVEEINTVRDFAETLVSPKMKPVALEFTPKYTDFHNCLPQNYKALQCWLTHKESYWSGEWRNSNMQELMEAVAACCYPYHHEATLFDATLRGEIDKYLQGIKTQLEKHERIKNNQSIATFLLLRAKKRLLHELLDSYRGFQAFFEPKAAIYLCESYGHALQENLRKVGPDCKADMQRGLRNWFALEAKNLCEEVMPKILQFVVDQCFALQTGKVRTDLLLCLNQMRLHELVSVRMTSEEMDTVFARVLLTELPPALPREMRKVDLTSLFVSLGHASPKMRHFLEDVPPVTHCPLKHGRSREGIYLSGIEYKGLLFNQKALHDVRVRCGRVEDIRGKGMSSFTTWFSKDAVLVEFILHHCLKKVSLSRTLDYYNCSYEFVKEFTAKVIEYVEST